MSIKTYWMNKSDAEFVLSMVEKYGNTTRAGIEEEFRTDLDVPVYEVTVTRHDRNTLQEDEPETGYATLREALLADAKRRKAQPLEAESWED